MTPENIAGTAELSYADIRVFLEDWRRELIELGSSEPRPDETLG